MKYRCTLIAALLGVGCLVLFWGWYHGRSENRALAESLYTVCERARSFARMDKPDLFWFSQDAEAMMQDAAASDRASIIARCNAHAEALSDVVERKGK